MGEKVSINGISNKNQWGLDKINEFVFISVPNDYDEINPNNSWAMIGFVYPWALRPELVERKDLLTEAINVLSPREKFIMIERRLKDKPKTLEDLSNHYKISRERVRQIEVRAFEKLKKSVKNLLVKKNLEREDTSDFYR